MRVQTLIKRLDEIGLSLEHSRHALALISLGSVGLELDRLDAYSDLDFFAIIEPGYKQQYLTDLHWLSDIQPVAYAFQNTRDGYKLLFADGVFCEFAVFEPDELEQVTFSTGRVVWKQPHISETISQPKKVQAKQESHTQDWLLGEALTNLYVGLARDKRGEKLSAMRFIQTYAVDRLLEICGSIEKSQPGFQDEFSLERRFEQRFPQTSTHLPLWMQGYKHNRESALAILQYLEQHFEVNPIIAAAIREYCA